MYNVRYRFIDLFAGIGGFPLQALSPFKDDQMASELDKECCKVYQQNYSIEPSEGEFDKI